MCFMQAISSCRIKKQALVSRPMPVLLLTILKFNIMKTHLFFDSRQLARAVADDDVIQLRLVSELLRIRFERLFHECVIFFLFY